VKAKIYRAVRAMLDQEEIILSEKLLKEIRFHSNIPMDTLKNLHWLITTIDKNQRMDLQTFDSRFSFNKVHLTEIQFK
jgi:hypothetical protein